MSKKTYLRIISAIALLFFGFFAILKLTSFDTYHLFLGNLFLLYNLIFAGYALSVFLGKKISLFFLIIIVPLSFTVGGFLFLVSCAIPAYFINKKDLQTQNNL